MFIPYGFTTDTHNITAAYDLLEGGLSLGPQEVAVNGDNLQEITADMLDFFNGSIETAEKFEVCTVSYVGDYADVEMRGEFYKEDGEGGYTTETIPVKVVIRADAK